VRFEVGFSLSHNGRSVWTLPRRVPRARNWRASQDLREEFAAHVIEVRHDLESLTARLLALQTFSRSQSDCNSGS